MHNPIDFSQARFKHLNWKFRIRNFLDGKELLTKEQAVSHQHCDLGKWYYADGKAKYGYLQEMKDFELEHKALHDTVKEIIQLKESGRNVESELKYKEILKASDTIVRLLNDAELKINMSADLSKGKLFIN
ncbi:MAG: CZB domain-containing protein [Bacteroidetes bacterium]|nr:CZB domain-containing protein [Bacteroidota bacterium]